MKVLVTGCAGLIGRHVSQQLLEESHSVVGLDSLNNAYDVRLKEWRLAQLEDMSDFEFRRLDITDRPALDGGLESENFDAVVHLAAQAGVRQSLEDPWCYYDTNVTGTLNILDLCRRQQINKFVLASTSSVYGEGPLPYREDACTDYPVSPYAASKKAAEVQTYAYHHLHGIDVSVLRFFTVYGPAGRPDMSIFRFIQQIAEDRPLTLNGDGTQERDFTYVGDIARGVVSALKPLEYEVINLGSDRPIVLRNVIEQIEENLGKKANITHLPQHPTDVKATWADITKAGTTLHWQPETDFETGLEKSVAWYLDNREWAKEIA